MSDLASLTSKGVKSKVDTSALQKKSHVSLSKTSAHANSTAQVKKQESSDPEASPMTVSWLQPAKFVQPLAEKKPALLEKSSTATKTASNEASNAALISNADGDLLWHAVDNLASLVSDSAQPAATAPEDALWHPAMVPAQGTGNSILSLLSTKAEGARKKAWTERPLEIIQEDQHQDPVATKKLASLLALSPTTGSQEISRKSSDIDSLVGDI